MIGVVLKRAVEEYAANFKVMLSFGILFLFLVLFIFFQQFFFSSGTVFLSFNSALLAILGLIIAVVFLYVFSFFVSLTVYSVHRDIQTISFDTYWNTLFKDAALKIFFFYLIFSVIFYVIGALGFMFGFVWLALLINLIIALAVMFVPQSIVLDEAPINDAIKKSVDFWVENFFTSFSIFIIASIILLMLIGLELALDLTGLPGVAISFLLTLVFLVPFVEQAKSYAFLLRVDLLKSNEVWHAHAPKKEKLKFVYSTRMREQPRRGSKL